MPSGVLPPGEVHSPCAAIALTIAWQFIASPALARTATAASIWLSFFLVSALAGVAAFVAFVSVAAFVALALVAFVLACFVVVCFFVFIVRPFRWEVSASGQSAGDSHK